MRQFLLSIALTTALLTGVAAGDQLTATTLDGQTFLGELREWSAENVTLLTENGQKQISTAGLMSLRWSPASKPAEVQLPIIELTDGSVLPIDGYSQRGNIAIASLRGAVPSKEKQKSLPIARIQAIRLQALNANLQQQWDEIRTQDLPSDVLVVLRRDGQSIDYVEGIVGDISVEDVEFKLDGEAMRVDRSKVAGIVFYRGSTTQVELENSSIKSSCVVHGRGGLHVVAKRVVLEDAMLHIEMAGDLQLDWPLADVEYADFSAGKVAFLSDLVPAVQKWTPLVGLPAGASIAANYGRPRLDQSGFGGPLSLLLPASGDSALVEKEQLFNKGIALRSRTEISYRLPQGYSRLLATAGIEPATDSGGNTKLTIHGDNRQLLEREISGGEAPLEIDLEIAGVRKLTLVVDYGKNLDTGDWLNLCNARIVK